MRSIREEEAEVHKQIRLPNNVHLCQLPISWLRIAAAEIIPKHNLVKSLAKNEHNKQLWKPKTWHCLLFHKIRQFLDDLTSGNAWKTVLGLHKKPRVCANQASFLGELPLLRQLPPFVWPSQHEGDVAVGLNRRTRDVQHQTSHRAQLADASRRRGWLFF